jgi:hypothetical protein
MMGLLKNKLSTGLGFIFYTLGVQYPVRLLFRLFGHRIWSPLGKLTAAISWLMGKIFFLFLARKKDDPINKARTLIDAVEGSIGILGTWEMKGPHKGIKRIYSCPYARRWGQADDFCPLMGRIMGQKSLEALFPGEKISYIMKSVLAKGDPQCEYEIELG